MCHDATVADVSSLLAIISCTVLLNESLIALLIEIADSHLFSDSKSQHV